MGRNIRINGTDYEVTQTWNSQEVIRLRDQTIYLASLDILGVTYTDVSVLPTEAGAYVPMWDHTPRTDHILAAYDIYQLYGECWYKNDTSVTPEQVLEDLNPSGYLAPLTFKTKEDYA